MFSLIRSSDVTDQVEELFTIQNPTPALVIFPKKQNQYCYKNQNL